MNNPAMPLDFWRQEIGYNPWHFWGLADASIVPVTSNCNDVVYEYAWQGADQLGRADIRQALMTAEHVLNEHLGYYPAPIYTKSKVKWPRYFDQRQHRTTRRDVRGGFIPVQMEDGHIQACGIERLDLIEAGAAIVYTDEDGDGLNDTFTVTVATTVTDPLEIAIYRVAADRLAEDIDVGDRWRIEPVTVTIAGGVATIVGKKWLCVRPILYENKGNYPIDPTVGDNFIVTVDVYRRYTYMDGDDAAEDSQAALIWESRPCSWCCDATDGSSDPASEGWVAGRAGVRDSENGIVIPAEAVYNATSGVWSHSYECFDCCGEPDRVLVRYLAGLPLDSYGWMQKRMRTMVSRLACAEMTRRICACDAANREWSNWQFDVSRVSGPETYQAALDVMNNPLGTRRGHIYAWQQIQSLARVSGILF